jgi:hypothetical protein
MVVGHVAGVIAKLDARRITLLRVENVKIVFA